MPSLKLNLPELIFAWQDQAADNAYYLDTESGDVKLVNRNLLDLRDLTDEIETNRERFIYVPKREKQHMILDLKEFWSSVSDDKLRNILSMAFESPHVESAFKKILAPHPEQLERFESFMQEKTKLRIEEWLQSHSLEYNFS